MQSTSMSNRRLPKDETLSGQLLFSTVSLVSLSILRYRSIVEEANKIAPAFSRLYKEFILFVSRDKPLPRAGKGTVMRKAALNVYSKEIDEM